MDSNTRIAFNTGILYIQLIITVVVNLISTRFILNAMGVDNFGIVSLIAGIVAMLSFVQNSMAISTQRYMSVYMGKKDADCQSSIFNTSMFLHCIFAIFILIVLELFEHLIFNSSINIPEASINSSKVLYQLTILGTLLVVLAVPYDAVINSHENMVVFSVISIVESLIRLGGALILLVYYHDKLIFYGMLIVVIRLTGLILKRYYCKRHYKETKFVRKRIDGGLMKELFLFAFWNMFGTLAMTGRTQGLAVILNTFFGVRVNAAYGIASQVGGQLSGFTSAIAKAVNPQIMQSAGANNNDRAISLSYMQSKLSSLLLSIAIIPLFFTFPFVLKLWLKTVPNGCVEFCRCILVVSLLSQMSTGLMTAVQSSGRIRNYQIIVSCIILSTLLFGYMTLRMGLPPISALVCMIIVEFFCLLFRAYYTHLVFKTSFYIFWKNVFAPVIVMNLISVSLSYFFNNFVLNGVDNFPFFCVSCIFSIITSCIAAFIVLAEKERAFILSSLSKAFKGICSHKG